MFMKSFLSGKICLTLVIIQKIQTFLMRQTKVIGKMKGESDGVIADEFVELKSKMYSMKKIDCKECNTAKRVSIATEFNKFKDVLLNKKLLDTKWKEFKVKSIN